MSAMREAEENQEEVRLYLAVSPNTWDEFFHSPAYLAYKGLYGTLAAVCVLVVGRKLLVYVAFARAQRRLAKRYT